MAARSMERSSHHAIEWENMLYFLYPYFWSHKNRWEEKKYLEHPDIMQKTFLKSGSARIVLKGPSKCTNEQCDSNIKSDDTATRQPWYTIPSLEYVNAIVIELRDVETFSDIDSLRAVVFDNDTIDVHAYLGEIVTIYGNIRVIPFPRKDTVSYLYAKTIEYESS
jgi:hypothetical protein